MHVKALEEGTHIFKALFGVIVNLPVSFYIGSKEPGPDGSVVVGRVPFLRSSMIMAFIGRVIR